MKKTTFVKPLSFLLALTLTAALFGACGGNGSVQASPTAAEGGSSGAADNEGVPVLRIGALHGLTGPNAALAAEFVGVIEAAADIINNSHPQLGDFPFAATEGIPGLGGAKIEIVKADTQSNPEVGSTEAERLITSEGIVALTGGHLSGVVKTASLAAEKLQMPYITGTATSPPLTERGLNYFFRATPTDETFMRCAFDFLDQHREEYDINTIAICAEEAEYGVLCQEIWTNLANERGYEIVESFTYPITPTSVMSESIKIKSADPDVLFIAAQISEAILFTNTFKQMEISPKIMLTARSGHIAPEWFNNCGEDTNFVSTANTWCVDIGKLKPFTEEINKIVKQHAGVELNGDYAREFQMIFILADALNRAGSTDPDAIRDAIAATDLAAEWLVTPWPGVRFDENGQCATGDGIITQVQNQEYVTVFPDEFKTADPIIPMPLWSER